MVQQDIRWIQRFEYTHELAWKVMKDYAEYQGYTDIRSSRDAIRKALEMGLIDDKQWTAKKPSLPSAISARVQAFCP